ncbi:MAG: prepilin-type N-terminal cleavage/methylation domain-containing protein [Patescibacteria group bacterium]|nr:prepilin-type N-terminal cleavage/methylation domain-containing protein [Patescibacteria group bacterium]
MLKQKKKINKDSGFTIVELLVVVLIIGLVVVALTMIMRSVFLSFDRTKRLETAKAQAQEAVHYITKVARMSDFIEITGGSGSEKMHLTWRRPNMTNNQGYEEQDIWVCKEKSSCGGSYDIAIEDFFSGAQIDNLDFTGSSTSGDNRVIVSFNILVPDRNSSEPIKIPFQGAVSLRSYKINP